MCERIKISNSVAVICGRGKHRQGCFHCGRMTEYQCDYPVKKYKNGNWKMCDRRLCSSCVQSGVTFGIDFCKEHYPMAKKAYERRQKIVL